MLSTHGTTEKPSWPPPPHPRRPPPPPTPRYTYSDYKTDGSTSIGRRRRTGEALRRIEAQHAQQHHKKRTMLHGTSFYTISVIFSSEDIQAAIRNMSQLTNSPSSWSPFLKQMDVSVERRRGGNHFHKGMNKTESIYNPQRVCNSAYGVSNGKNSHHESQVHLYYVERKDSVRAIRNLPWSCWKFAYQQWVSVRECFFYYSAAR